MDTLLGFKEVDNYNEDAIEVLSELEAKKRFPYRSAEMLIDTYPEASPTFINRLVTACSIANFPIYLAELRYLKKDKQVYISDELHAVYKKLLDKERFR